MHLTIGRTLFPAEIRCGFVLVLIALLVSAGFVEAQTITTFAGSDFLFTGDGQPGVNVALAQPTYLNFDASGNLYIVDTELSTLMKLSPSGIVSVVAGGGLNQVSGDGGPARNAGLGGSPAGVTVDSAGNIYVADEFANIVRKITPNGVINTIAGTGAGGFSGDGGPAVKAALYGPASLSVDSQGNLYIFVTNGPRIRKISSAGTITTIAGNGLIGSSGDGGPAINAELSNIGGLTIDSQGNLYFADSDSCRIRRIDTTGNINTVAGTVCGASKGDNGPALSAQFNVPSGVAFDGQGNLYVSELIGNRIRRIDTNGNITTVAGNGSIGFSGDGGGATQAMLSAPESIAVDPSGRIWIADRDNQRVRYFSLGGNISTAVGIGSSVGDGGPASGAKLENAFSIARDSSGNVYIADFGHSRIRKVALGGTVTTIAGTGRTSFSPDGTLATSANLSATQSVAVSPQGNVVFTDSGNGRIRQINSDGTLATIAGTGAFGGAGDGGQATSAVLGYPLNLFYAPNGNLYFTNTPTGGVQVRVISATGIINTIAGNGQTAFSGDNGPATSAGIGQCIGIAVDGAGNLYILDLANERIRKVTPGGTITTIAGNGTMGYSADGTAAANATLNLDGSGSAVIDSSGRLLFPDNNRIRAIAADGTLTTIAGTGMYTFAGDGGPPLAASFGSAAGMVFDPYGNLLIADTGNTRIREVFNTPSPVMVPSQSGLTFSTAAGVSPQPQTFTVVNGGPGTLVFGLAVSSNASWISLSATSGVANSNAAGVPVIVTLNSANLSAGDYYGSITISAPGVPNSPQVVTVVLHVAAAGSLPTDVTLSPAGLIFTAALAGPAPAPQSIILSTASTQSLNYTASLTFSGATFFTLANPSGAVTAGHPVTFTIAPATAGLAVGVYGATLSLSASPAPTKLVNVILVVGPAGTPTSFVRPDATASCVPSKLLPVVNSITGGFNVIAAWPVPIEVAVVDDCGNSISSGSVVASFSTSDPPLTLNSLQNGSWAATWQTSSSLSQVTITINASSGKPSISGAAQVTGGLTANQNPPPSIAQGGVLNAASYKLNSSVAPGSLIAIFGQNLTGSVASASTLPLPDTINGTMVALGGQALPLVFVSSTQINAVLPYTVPANGPQQIVVTNGSAISVPQSVTITPALGGVFTQNAQGTGIGIIVLVNSNGSEVEVSAAQPATAGSVLVVYSTGLGDVNPRLLAGAAVPVTPLSSTISPVSATIGGKPAQVLFGGPTPGFTGLYQVNLIVPSGVTTGSAVPLVLTQNGLSSPTVTIPIQ